MTQCYKITNKNGIVHYTDQETELGVFCKKYGKIWVEFGEYPQK